MSHCDFDIVKCYNCFPCLQSCPSQNYSPATRVILKMCIRSWFSFLAKILQWLHITFLKKCPESLARTLSKAADGLSYRLGHSFLLNDGQSPLCSSSLHFWAHVLPPTWNTASRQCTHFLADVFHALGLILDASSPKKPSDSQSLGWVSFLRLSQHLFYS